MNILMIDYEYPPVGGGGGVFNKQIAEELAQKHAVTVITSGFKGLPKKEIVNGVEILRVPVAFRKNMNAASIVSMLSFFPSSVWAGNALLRRRKIDIVHSFFAIPSAPSGYYLARKYHIPHFLTLLGGDVYDPSKKLSPHNTPLLKQTVRKMIQDSDKVIADSIDIKKRAIEYFGASNSIDMISLGIERPQFKRVERSDFQLDESDILLVTVGRLVARKNLANLLHCLEEIEDPKVKALIIGDGPKMPELVQQAEKLGLSDRVRFFGRVNDQEKFQILSLSDIYVSTSDHEGFGLVFLEGMATGLPVVCYDKGGQNDFLKDGETGFVVPLGENELFAAQLSRLCGDEQLRRAFKQFNSQYVEKFFMEHCAQQYDDLYRGYTSAL